MATLDLILLACFIPGLIRGFSKGFLEQVLALAGAVVSVWAAFRFSGLLAVRLQPYLDLSETTLHVVAFALILAGIILGAFLLARLATRTLELAMVGWLDKLLGLVFALAVNALVIGVFIIMFDTLNVKFGFVKPEILDGSVVYTGLRDLSYFAFPYLKELIFKS